MASAIDVRTSRTQSPLPSGERVRVRGGSRAAPPVMIRVQMQNRWNDTPENEIEQLVHQSRLVGMEEDLVLWGGGNNSIKSRATDLLGRPIEVMYIKSSGSDMKSIVPKQFPAVRLDYIAPLRQRDEEMTDPEMVDYRS